MREKAKKNVRTLDSGWGRFAHEGTGGCRKFHGRRSQGIQQMIVVGRTRLNKCTPDTGETFCTSGFRFGQIPGRPTDLPLVPLGLVNRFHSQTREY